MRKLPRTRAPPPPGGRLGLGPDVLERGLRLNNRLLAAPERTAVVFSRSLGYHQDRGPPSPLAGAAGPDGRQAYLCSSLREEVRMSESCRIDIKPLRSRADQPIDVLKISGLKPGGEVTVQAETRDEGGRSWISRGILDGDETGTIDLSRQAPKSGTFKAADPSAILWSLRPEGNPDIPVPLFKKKTVAPLSIKISVVGEGKTLAEKNIERVFGSPDREIIREPVAREGVTGILFYPAGGERCPVVICLSGSGGGIDEPRAALLAAHGYTVFALAYFGAGSLPKDLYEIPVEFFQKGLDWLEEQGAADPERVAVYGYSKGGELALLLASLYPRIKAAAAFAGSSHVWQGLRFGRPGSSWSRRGNSLPYLPMKVPLTTVFKLMLGRAVAFRGSYERGFASVRDPEAAAIQVEKINGPVLLVAGTEDQVWPAADFAERVAARLKENRQRYPLRYLKEEGAGHLVGLPYLPSAEVCRNLIFTSADIESSTLASTRAWEALVDFLRESLR